MKSASFVLLLSIVGGAPRTAMAEEDAKPDPNAVALLNGFMSALAVADEKASAKATLPFVHRSLKNAAGDDLSADLRRFSFKKAHDGSKFYAAPVKITRVRPTNTTAIGFKETAEAGRVDDYFIAKKEGVNGMPAPVKIFFPKDGSEPRISYMGSI